MPSIGTTVNSTFDPWAVTSKIDEKDARYALAGYAQPQPGSVMSYKSGVFAGGSVSGATLGNANHGGLRVTVGATGSAPTAVVAIGNCLIDTPSNGPYLCGLDSQKTISLATPSSTQRRIDLIVARVYDDRNSAIGSAAGDRRFVIQAVTGDNTSGTPVVPTAALPTNGWIPLAALQIEANGATITVTEMRGPGLVARGGRRILYGNDAKITSTAFLEAGAYAGDQRYVVGHPFPNQTYYVSSDAGTAGWRGDGGELVFTQTAPNVGTRSATAGGTIMEIQNLVVPAYGIPVTLTPRARWKPAADGDMVVEFETLVDGVLCNYQTFNTWGQPGRLHNPITAPDFTVGPYTTSKTVSSSLNIIGGSPTVGLEWDTAQVGWHTLQVIVKPANIDPIRVWL
ncbi:hypothetical protein ACFWY9_28580 [Amycolatopsis sp. NPDC059027]|uniref:hypothetical protein n=1 Tax=Amycolatopsis sp. NPDC059027 TaxID=3346709 RepID=UPI003670A753